MPGPIKIDARNIKPLSNIAYKDKQGKWRAGPDAKDEYVDAAGNITDASYARQARSQRKRTNLVKANMRKREMSESKAREFVNEKLDKLESAKDEGDEDRIADVRQSLHGS